MPPRIRRRIFIHHKQPWTANTPAPNNHNRDSRAGTHAPLANVHPIAYDDFHSSGPFQAAIGGHYGITGGIMKGRLPILNIVLVLLCVPILSAQDWARAKVDKSPRHREWVTVKHDSRSVDTFVVYPEVSDKRPVVLIIHEIFGMTDWVQDLADQVAEAGYIAVAPDLLSGMGPNGGASSAFPQGEAVKAVSHLNPDQNYRRPQCRRRLRAEDPFSEQQALRGRFLLGRWAKLPFCHQPFRPLCCLRLLWTAAARRCHDSHQGSGVRILCRE